MRVDIDYTQKGRTVTIETVVVIFWRTKLMSSKTQCMESGSLRKLSFPQRYTYLLVPEGIRVVYRVGSSRRLPLL